MLQYDKNTEPALQIVEYLVLLTPIILSWVETWLLDLKVIPEEKREVEASK